MAGLARWAPILQAAKDEAVVAVRHYNDPMAIRRLEGFIVHMHVAWLYLLHARYVRDGVDMRYRDRANARRFIRVDGEFKLWELARCVEERWKDGGEPTRLNLEFFIALRNRIEHRHRSQDASLALIVGGRAQALLLNFEQELTTTFGATHSLADRLTVPIFIGSFTAEGEKTLTTLARKLPADLRRFLAEFDAGLSAETATHPRFDLRLRVLLERSLNASDSLAVKFTRWDDMSDAEKAAAEVLGKRGQVIVREQTRRIVGADLLLPTEVQRRVGEAIPFAFNSFHNLRAWQRKGIRPPNADPKPAATDEKYCVYDQLSQQYGYTEAWVQWLIKNCSTAEGFAKVTGRTAKSQELPVE